MATVSTPGFPANFVANLPTVPNHTSHPGQRPDFMLTLPSGGSYSAQHPGLPPSTQPYKYTGQAK
jgi:hypothetical protein